MPTVPILKELQHKPLVLAAIGLILGILTRSELWFGLPLIPALLAFRGLRPLLTLAFAFAVGVLLGQDTPEPLTTSQPVSGEATVASVPRLYDGYSTCEVSIQGTRLLMRSEERLNLGDRLFVTGVARPFREGTEGSQVREGIVGRLVPAHIEVVRQGPAIFRAGDSWRRSFMAFCEDTLQPRVASAVEAICFNVDTALDPDDRDALRRSGLIHIVSASGFHVAALAAVLAFFLSLAPIPRSAQIGAILLVLAFYAAATGTRPPVIRSVLMIAMVMPAYLFKREPDLLTALAVAAIVQLLWQPYAVYDPGFQLSFLVVTALALFSPPNTESAKGALRVPAELKHASKQGVVALLASAPVIAYVFRSTSLTALPANALTTLVLPFITVGAMAAHVVSFVVPAVGVGMMRLLVEPLTGWLFQVVDWFGGAWASPAIPFATVPWLLLAYVVAAAVWRPSVRPA